MAKSSIGHLIGTSEIVGDKIPQHVSLVHAKTLISVPINCSSSGDNTIVASVANKRIKGTVIVVNFAGTVSAYWKSGSTALGGAMPFQEREGYTVAGDVTSPVIQTAAGEALVLNLNGAVAATGWLMYHADDAT